MGYWVRYALAHQDLFVAFLTVETLKRMRIGYVINVDTNLRHDKDYRIWIALMELGKRYGCHQKPERSFTFNGYQFPICARCTGIILGEILGIIVLVRKKISIKKGMLLILPTVIDGGTQLLGFQESNNARRFITGELAGIGYSACICDMVLWLLRLIVKRRCASKVN